jgi:hypothetical protein
MFDQVSLSGTDDFLVQIGTSGTPTTSGYASVSSDGTTASTSTAGFVVRANTAADTYSVLVSIVNITGTAWVQSHSGARAGGGLRVGGGRVDIGAVLDNVRVTRTGTNTFDNGQVNILYE